MFTISASSTAARPTVVAHRRANKTRAKRSVVVHGAKSNPVSSGYAAALVDACKSSGALEQVHADMETLDAYVKANASVAGFLANPTIVAEKKKDVLAKLGKEAGFHAFTGNFLNLLVDKRRENQIEAIIAEFETLFCEATDTQVATVTSAVKLENEQQFMIAKKLQEMTGAKNIKLKPEVDESLLGGFVVQYGKDGSGFIDMSVRGQVDKLASVFVN
ncbi:F-ATPase family transporter: protons [Ostreococcus lucimarinus CCE9901]|uniref:F-ATPase family transporter: protons (Chloroplast) n=1 Tax=Ostreococcus lucimarinus (strain CCE9901) TaxID=436017 RepID=A4RZW9_OSTLU|nr:F-ATPase family transporter: protons [Ostreococcus lucimarinus CCE9901]ABO96934.1 F-ATPase family transporter: protons [Ostreococcus lucimarinus CCE9901]|eukprot:XP_001418641.1 F-ATPase family transporter: protons [Ostreococcus lucimarinus CCE9901]